MLLTLWYHYHICFLSLVPDTDLLHNQKLFMSQHSIAANRPKSPPKNQFLFHTPSPILGMGSSYTAAMAQKRSINSAGRRQCHFKPLKMALSSTSRVNRSFLSHCCSVAGSHSKNGTRGMK